MNTFMHANNGCTLERNDVQRASVHAVATACLSRVTPSISTWDSDVDDCWLVEEKMDACERKGGLAGRRSG